MGTTSKTVTHLEGGLPTTETVDSSLFGQGTAAQRPASGSAIGDLYVVIDHPVYRMDIWNGSGWELVGSSQPDLSKVVIEEDGSVVYTGDGDITTVE